MRSTQVHKGYAGAAAASLAGLVAGLLVGVPYAHAAPANPTDAQLAQSQQQVRSKAAEVGRITAALVRADAALEAAASRAEAAVERYNKARVDEEVATRLAGAAARRGSLAQADVAQMLDRMDRMAASNYKDGGSLGPLAAIVTADRPGDVIHDAGVLAVMNRRQVDTLADLDRARARASNALSSARAALARQAAARRAAEAAKHAAEQARADSQREAGRIAGEKVSLQHDLARAQARAGLLVAARQAAIARARAEAAARAAAARAAAIARANAAAQARRAARRAQTVVPTSAPAAPSFPAPPPRATRSRSGNPASVAISAALSQLGKPYVWGASGPDAFDCSGLTLWAYAQAGVYLPHFSGYQYTAGPHVPLGALAPGDLVFYSSNGAPSGIHHVAMYIGGGAMVEAPTQGIPVRVHVMYSAGLLPLATRPY